MIKTATHPTLPWTLTFDPVPHTYHDNLSRPYTSVTSLVRRYFPPFDAPAAAARVAARDGLLELDVLNGWKAEGERAASRGSRIHAYAESRVIGATPELATSPDESRAFGIVDEAILALEKQYEFLGAEQIVFDPFYLLAGAIDLPARNRATGAVAILDWKTNAEITNDAWGRTGLPPISHIPDSKLSHHALQLSLYAWLIADCGYIAPSEPVELAVIHIPPTGHSPVWIPLPYDPASAELIVLDYWRKELAAQQQTAERSTDVN